MTNPKNPHSRERLTVDLPPGALTALKIHAAQRESTIRAVVKDLVQTAINERENT